MSPPLRVLLASGDAQRHVPRPVLSSTQVNVDAGQLNRECAGVVLSRFVPYGSYDLAAVIDGLPPEQRPDVVACALDGASRSWPANLAACPGTKVLLLGDMLAHATGAGTLPDYLRRENFDRVVMTGSVADRDLLLACGVRELHWLPGLLCPVGDRLARQVRQKSRQDIIAAPPPEARRHTALNLALAALHRRGLAANYWGNDFEERLEHLGHAAFALLPSAHGEWRPEWFEALAAGTLVGGAVPEMNADAFGGGAVPWIAADSAAELIERIVHFQHHPAEAQARRAATAAWFDAQLGEARRRGGFETLIWAPARLPVWCRTSAVHFPPPVTMVPEKAADLAAAIEGLLARRPEARVRLAAEVPAWMDAILRHYPRVRLHHTGDGPAEIVISAAGDESPEGAEISWIPDDAGGCLHRRPATLEAERQLAAARVWLDDGEPEKALQAGQPLLSHPLVFADALVIAADAATELDHRQVWTACRGVLQQLDAADARLRHLEVRQAHRIRLHTRRQLAAGWRQLAAGDVSGALDRARRLVEAYPLLPRARLLQAWALWQAGSEAAAVPAWEAVVRLDPNRADLWLDLAILRWNTGDETNGRDALRRALELRPDFPAARRLAAVAGPQPGTATAVRGPVRDLLVTMPETNRRHGTGVLLRRFFPDSRDFVTLRSCTNYQGLEEFGGLNLLADGRGLNEPERAARLRRLLEPFHIRRILCVPFAPTDFRHAQMIRGFTGAPLCTYVMDDQNLTVGKVADEDVHGLFAVSDLRLVISPEMRTGYEERYGCAVDLMPPIVIDRAARRNNRWKPAVRPPHHVALVGNVWSDGQLRQVARFAMQAGLSVDWFGRGPHAGLARVGLHGQGFLPEPELADRLTTYPYVLVPSGALDGTEDNEWLTRLSLPSRMVFLLQTQTPMLVLGSAETAAARFVRQLGLGAVLPYNSPDPRRALRALTQPPGRDAFLARAADCAEGFVMPGAGEWIWASLAAGRALPAPFDAVYGGCAAPLAAAG